MALDVVNSTVNSGDLNRKALVLYLHKWDYGDHEGLTTPEIDGTPRGKSPAELGARADRVSSRTATISELGPGLDWRVISR